MYVIKMEFLIEEKNCLKITEKVCNSEVSVFKKVICLVGSAPENHCHNKP